MTRSIFEQFVEEAKQTGFTFPEQEKTTLARKPLSNDALFHTPLLAICVLILVREARKGCKAGELGRLVGLLLEETFSGFKGSSQSLSWSGKLFRRTAEATAFLEHLKLIERDRKNHCFSTTEAGRKFLLEIRKEASELSVAVGALARNCPDAHRRAKGLL